MRHFLSLLDYTSAEIRALLDRAIELKKEWQQGGNPPLLKGKILGMLFMKPSLRTRVSFEVGMQHLGGSAIYLGPSEVALGEREAVMDVARTLGRYVNGIMARVFAYKDVQTLAAYSGVPVINGLSDYNHPCQALADMLTILEHFGTFQNLTIAYVGDSNNVARSLLFITSKLGVHLNLASPRGYEMDEDSLEAAKNAAPDGKAFFSLYQDPYAAVKNAAIIYTDTWTSMGQEAEQQARRQVFPPYQVNAALLNAALPEAMVMHCLPAHRGEEITDEVMDGKRSLIFQQAENRLHAQKAVLAMLMAN